MVRTPMEKKKTPSGIHFQMLGVAVVGMLEWKVLSVLVSLVPAIIINQSIIILFRPASFVLEHVSPALPTNSQTW